MEMVLSAAEIIQNAILNAIKYHESKKIDKCNGSLLIYSTWNCTFL